MAAAKRHAGGAQPGGVNPDAARVRADFDRIALLSAGRPEEARYQDWLLRHVPHPCERALDIGCGTGSLARALAHRAARVQAIDLSPGMVRAARERSAGHANIEFRVGDFLSLELPRNHFDCIVAVAALHHMPWTRAVEKARESLRAGGRLLIVDLFEDDGIADRLRSGAAWTLQALGRLKGRPPRELREAWADHGRGDVYPTISEARRLCRGALPGAVFRRHLFWRYSVVWTKVA